MKTHKDAYKASPSLLKDFTIPFFVILFGYGLGIFLYNEIGIFGAFFIPIIISIVLALTVLSFSSNSEWRDEAYGTKLFWAFIIGLFAGIFIISVANAISHTKANTAPATPSYYEGIVQAISININSYVQFT
ncbi:MAG: hypothetical protein QXN16_03010, partial [Candidatus Micrarchaeaceae archaeon]